MPKLAAENARGDEPMAKEEQEDRVKIEDGHDKKRQGVALGDKPGVALQHKDDDKMGKQTGSNGTKTHAEAMTVGWLGDFSWINDDMRDKKSTSMSSSGNDNLKGDAEGPTKKSGQRLKVRGTSSCPAESEPSALTALQLLAKGVRTGCALSPAAWAKISKLKKEEAKGAGNKNEGCCFEEGCDEKNERLQPVAKR